MNRHATVYSLALAAGLVSSAVAAQPRAASPEVTALAGGYEIANADGTRKCLVVLRAASVPGGHGVGFTPHCRIALPIMASVAAWTAEPLKEAPHARIRLHNAVGAVLLDFSAAGQDGTASARDVTNASYSLKPHASASLEKRMASLQAQRPAVPRTAAAAAAQRMPDPVTMQQAAGTYSLLRDKGRETGCTVALAASGGQGTAKLATGCGDAGITVFAPTAWHITDGTLWLVGGKGQRLSFERNRRAGWDKGAGQGAVLSLMRSGN